MKLNKTLIIRVCVLLILLYFIPWFVLFMFACGLIDCLRNRPLNSWLFHKYFWGKGMTTWVFSPINLFADLIAMSWKCTWKKEEFPSEIQQEIDHLIANIPTEQIIESLNGKMGDSQRGMIFFKWYGHNQETNLDIPAFHHEYKYIQTIGVSAFNKHASTSRHFGPLRLTYRLLYNLQPRKHHGIYIETSNQHHFWHDNPMFIFDDTYVHQSFNEADQVRYCMFVDFIRPSPFPFGYAILHKLTQGLHWLLKQKSFAFYKAWKNIGAKEKSTTAKNDSENSAS